MQTALSLHDAVEFCLRAIAEEFDLALGQNDNLTQIFGVVDKHFAQENPPKKLPRQTQISFLNTTRGKIKHYASVPSPQDTENCVHHATYFLEQVSQDYFGVSFERVSLVTLVRDEALRQLLHKAEDGIVSDQFLQALTYAKIAYLRALPSAELFLGTHRSWHRFRGFSSFSQDISTRASSGSMITRNRVEVHIDTSGISKAIKETAKQAENAIRAVVERVDVLEQALVHLLIGGDVLAARRFDEITPRVFHDYETGRPQYLWRKGKEATPQMAQEAVEYSTQMLLRWQDIGIDGFKQNSDNTHSGYDWDVVEMPDDSSPPSTSAEAE